jgi:pimeloyl-ACP methyl ester carboxylesterase
MRGVTGAVLAAAVALPALPGAAAPPAPAAVVTAAPVDPADRVPTPQPRWFRCFGGQDGAQCATVEVPLDYDSPKGPTTSIAVVRLRTADPAKRVGSLFLNPGGPGGSGVGIALAAPSFLGPEVLERFDVVGIDPRGVNFSDNVRCFRNFGEQEDVLTGLLSVSFPYTRSEVSAAVRSARQIGQACSTTGRPLTAAMSTSAVARDMDLMRRAVGDRRLTYLGFSYGSYLGQVYAGLFPQRVRAIAIDGVVDPRAWAGLPSTRNTPISDRLRSADGAWKALTQILDRCDEAGPEQCEIAPDARGTLDRVVADLRAEPLEIEQDGFSFTLSYATFVGFLLSDLYAPTAWQWVVSDIVAVRDLLDERAGSGLRDAAVSALRDAQQRSLIRAFEWPYDNSFEAFATVFCTDSRNPASALRWPALAAPVDARAPLFGRLWLWQSAQCAESTWTVRDEDAYRGPFTRRTSAPVLVVGNYWDPATRYEGAVRASRLLPNSRLLSSDSWGHTAYGTSACVTDAVDAYLAARTLPPAGTVCVGDDQPFQGSSARRAGPDRRPPVVPLIPGGPPPAS